MKDWKVIFSLALRSILFVENLELFLDRERMLVADILVPSLGSLGTGQVQWVCCGETVDDEFRDLNSARALVHEELEEGLGDVLSPHGGRWHNAETHWAMRV